MAGPHPAQSSSRPILFNKFSRFYLQGETKSSCCWNNLLHRFFLTGSRRLTQNFNNFRYLMLTTQLRYITLGLSKFPRRMFGNSKSQVYSSTELYISCVCVIYVNKRKILCMYSWLVKFYKNNTHLFVQPEIIKPPFRVTFRYPSLLLSNINDGINDECGITLNTLLTHIECLLTTVRNETSPSRPDIVWHSLACLYPPPFLPPKTLRRIHRPEMSRSRLALTLQLLTRALAGKLH